MTTSSSDLFRSEGLTQRGGTPKTPAYRGEATLVDAVDHLLNRGAVLVGEATISLAGIDLIYVGLNLLISSVETLEAASSRAASPPHPLPEGEGDGELASDIDQQGSPASPKARPHPNPLPEGEGISAPFPSQREGGEGARSPGSPLSISDGEGQGVRPPGAEDEAAASSSALPAERPEQGLARLVLTLVELLRQTLERQAVRRMEGGALAEEDIERMGIALLELEQKMAELREIFGLEEAELNLDLGPLGRLL